MENPFQLIMDRLDAIEKLLKETKVVEYPQNKMDQLMGMKEAHEYLGIAKATLYGYIHFRKVPHYKVGNRSYFKKEELENWVFTNKVLTREEIEEKASEYILRKRQNTKF